MNLCFEPGDVRISALCHLRQELQQLLGTADQLSESVLAAHLCHALDQVDLAIFRLDRTEVSN